MGLGWGLANSEHAGQVPYYAAAVEPSTTERIPRPSVALPPSRVSPGIDRDLLLVLAEAVRWADTRAALQSANLPALDPDNGIEFVTTFRNAQIGKGNKSLTLTLHFRAPERTLTSEEVDAQVRTAVDLLMRTFQATLRA